MRLRNKKTGEIVTPACFDFCLLRGVNNRGIEIKGKWYNSLTEISKEWEDYEEPKGYWYIRDGGNIDFNLYGKSIIVRHKAIGNYFDTEEEAEKAVEKLKAWKWLKDNGVILKYDKDTFTLHIVVSGKMSPNQWRTDGYMQKLDLIFGGEE